MNLNLVLAYEFARGYYDGRNTGCSNPPEFGTDDQVEAYKAGYDAGVTDYCEIDELLTDPA